MPYRRLSRRTVLRGAGAALALPFLDAMASGKSNEAAPRRFCAFYFPYGVSLPDKDSEDAQWRWFPEGGERDFRFTKTLEVLEPLRNEITILQGPVASSVPRHGRARYGRHVLDGQQARRASSSSNTVSVDQVAAAAIGHHTRYSSLVLSTDGGVGEPTRASTLSFTENGHPIPAINSPRTVFNRLFGAGDADLERERRSLHSSASMLDRVLDHSKQVRRDLGAQDQAKLDEYLESVRRDRAARRPFAGLARDPPSGADRRRPRAAPPGRRR